MVEVATSTLLTARALLSLRTTAPRPPGGVIAIDGESYELAWPFDLDMTVRNGLDRIREQLAEIDLTPEAVSDGAAVALAALLAEAVRVLVLGLPDRVAERLSDVQRVVITITWCEWAAGRV